ncbi:MAG TPA: class I SAM-dependent methyltransferase [Candidatus Eisenbacteria bacterium]|nr:class I SAM-dependent methyltransferase [Candidatus Eisenbacteria bacterium]
MATDDRLEANRRMWDERVDVHRRSAYYDLDGFREGRSSLRAVELEELGDVAGRSLLHLQCHFGLDTLSLARLGARVAGVDFSEPAVALARRLAGELGIDARFIQSDVYELTRVLHEQFDVVFTSHGVLCWLPDVRAWARVVARFLRPGGTFVIVDGHPIATCFEEVDGRLDLVYPLFQREPFELVSTSTYADADAVLPARTNYQWSWTVGGMVTALIDAGLRVERLRELPLDTWRRFPSMTVDDEGWWRLPGDPLPLLVACRAVKPL